MSMAYRNRHGDVPRKRHRKSKKVDKPRAHRVQPCTPDQYLAWLVHCSMRVVPTNQTMFGVAPSLYARRVVSAAR